MKQKKKIISIGARFFTNVLDRKDLQGHKVGKCQCGGDLIQTERRANECNRCDFYCAPAC